MYCVPRGSRVRLVDFNPFSPATDSLLFEWSEILYSSPDGLSHSVEFRIVESNEEAQGNQPAYTHNRLPKEAFDFSGDASTIAEFAQRFNQEIVSSSLQRELE